MEKAKTKNKKTPDTFILNAKILTSNIIFLQSHSQEKGGRLNGEIATLKTGAERVRKFPKTNQKWGCTRRT
jgi:hypothetical protein